MRLSGDSEESDDPFLTMALRELAKALEARAEGRTDDALRHAVAVSPLLVDAILRGPN